MRRFARTFAITDETRILDVGGAPFNWSLLDVQPRVTIVNMLRTHRLEWPQIVRVNLRPGDPWVLLDLDSGDTQVVGTLTKKSAGTWTLTFSTAGWTAGTYSFFAAALDSDGVFSDPLRVAFEVL